MIRKLAIMLALMLVVVTGAAAYTLPDYDIEGAGTGQEGTYLIKVSVISSKKEVDNDMLAKCAVHGVLFRGFSNGERRSSQKPLVGGPANEASHQEYYEGLFGKNGSARQYVQTMGGTRSVTKLNKKQYRVSATVVVSKEQLARDLRDAGVAGSLNSMF